MAFLNCNLDTGVESYGLENTGISRGTGIFRATENSRNSGIPETQTFPSRESPVREFPGNSRDSGISLLAVITGIPVPWKIPVSKCTYIRFSTSFLH